MRYLVAMRGAGSFEQEFNHLAEAIRTARDVARKTGHRARIWSRWSERWVWDSALDSTCAAVVRSAPEDGNNPGGNR